MEHLDRTVFGFDRRPIKPTIAVALVVILFGAALPFINHLVSAEEEIDPGTVLDVGLGVSFTPVAGWQLNTDATVPGTDTAPGVVGVSETGLLYTVSVQPTDAELDDLMATATEERAVAVDAFDIASPQTSTSTEQGVTGLTETYHGVGVQGSLSVFVSDGIAVVVDADGPEGTLSLHAAEIDAMTRSIRFEETGADR